MDNNVIPKLTRTIIGVMLIAIMLWILCLELLIIAPDLVILILIGITIGLGIIAWWILDASGRERERKLDEKGGMKE